MINPAPVPCYFCGSLCESFCTGCGHFICASCDNETLEDGAHDPEAHLDIDDSGYETVSDEEAE